MVLEGALRPLGQKSYQVRIAPIAAFATEPVEGFQELRRFRLEPTLRRRLITRPAERRDHEGQCGYQKSKGCDRCLTAKIT